MSKQSNLNGMKPTLQPNLKRAFEGNVWKSLWKIVMNKLKKEIEGIITENQAGFIESKLCTSMGQQLLEKKTAENRSYQ